MMNKFAEKYAVGAISRSVDLIDLIIEARKGKKAIRLYCVGQMGHIDTFYITSKSRFVRNKREAGDSLAGPAYDEVPGFKDHTSIGMRGTNRRWFRDRIFAGSYDLDGCSRFAPEHRLFANRDLAERYSKALQADPEYVAGVHRHWARCRSMFASVSW